MSIIISDNSRLSRFLVDIYQDTWRMSDDLDFCLLLRFETRVHQMRLWPKIETKLKQSVKFRGGVGEMYE